MYLPFGVKTPLIISALCYLGYIKFGVEGNAGLAALCQLGGLIFMIIAILAVIAPGIVEVIAKILPHRHLDN